MGPHVLRLLEEPDQHRLVEQRGEDLFKGEGPFLLLLLPERGAVCRARVGGAPLSLCALQPAPHFLHPQEEAGDRGDSPVQGLLLGGPVEEVIQGLGELNELGLKNKAESDSQQGFK